MKLVIQVRDSGTRLDAGQLARRPSSPLDCDVRTLPERGYGLFILREVLDEVAYETHAGDNVLTLIKTLRSLGAPSPKGTR
jgi:serine/threonine-protein kinase RsbW